MKGHLSLHHLTWFHPLFKTWWQRWDVNTICSKIFDRKIMFSIFEFFWKWIIRFTFLKTWVITYWISNELLLVVIVLHNFILNTGFMKYIWCTFGVLLLSLVHSICRDSFGNEKHDFSVCSSWLSLIQFKV